VNPNNPELPTVDSSSAGQPADQGSPPSEPIGKEHSLRKLALRGSFWTIGNEVLSQAIRFGANLVLTRLLFPEAFGLMLLVNTFLQGLSLFSDIGINVSIIQHPAGDDPKFLNTAWTVQVIRGGVLGLLCLALSYPFAAFYEQPELLPLIQVASLAAFLEGTNSTSLAAMSRHLSVARLAILRTGVQVVASTVMIIWAVVYPSVWALLGGSLISYALESFLSHFLFRENRNRFELHKPFLGALLSFGTWVLFSTMLSFSADYLDRFFLGKMLNLAELGVYQIAVVIGGLPSHFIMALGASVLFPLFSRARHRGDDLVHAYDRVRLPILVLGALAISGVISTGPGLIQLLYPEEYWGAAWMLVFICAGQWFRVLSVPPFNVLFAMGMPQWSVVANGARVLGYLAIVPTGFRLWGAPGALAGFAGGEALGFVVYSVGVLRHKLSKPSIDLLVSATALVAAGGGFAVQVYCVDAGLPLILAVLAAGIVTCLIWLPFAPKVLHSLRSRE
jgi:O-antigen/teichoic acid export membrane protein